MILLCIVVLEGRKDWIILTKGKDITEAIEAHHVFGVPQIPLDKFWVKKATNTRKAWFTFDENGSFKTIQRKGEAILRKVGTGPTLLSTLTVDFLVVSIHQCIWLLLQVGTVNYFLISGRYI